MVGAGQKCFFWTLDTKSVHCRKIDNRRRMPGQIDRFGRIIVERLPLGTFMCLEEMSIRTSQAYGYMQDDDPVSKAENLGASSMLLPGNDVYST